MAKEEKNIQESNNEPKNREQTTSKPTGNDDFESVIKDLRKQVAEMKAENIKIKKDRDKLSHSEAEMRKKLNAKMTIEEQDEQQQLEQEQYVKGLEKRVKVMEQSSLLQAKGFSNEDAKKIAEARYDGDLDTAESLMNAHYDALEKQRKEQYEKKMAELMKPASGNGGVDYQTQLKAAQENGNILEAIKLIREQAEQG